MKILPSAILLASLTIINSVKASESSDSIAALTLSEVTVTAKDVYKVADGYAFVPSKTLKKTSFDVKQMISRVPLSNVVVDFQGNVSDLRNNPAKYFIDSKPATQEEINALINQDVERIEFLNNPSNGTFLGEKFAINIITRKTVYGGYVIAGANQQFIQPFGNYSLSGKFVGSEKWSLMAIGSYNYSKGTGSHGTETTKYDLEDHVTGEMVHIDRISQQTGSLRRNHTWSGALYWRYKTSGNSELSVTAGISSSRTSDNNETGVLEHDTGHDGTPFFNLASGRSQNPYIAAYWIKNFSNGMTLYVLGDLHATFSKSWLDYISGNDPTISNYFREKGYSPNIHANWTIPLKHNNSLTFDADYKTARFNVDYAGTTNTVENRHEDNYSIDGNYQQNFDFGNQELDYEISTKLPIRTITMSDGRKYNAFDFFISSSIDYSFKQNHSLGLSAEYYLTSRPISTMNDLKIQDTDISGHQGNPNLKSNQNLEIDATYTWMASNSFNLSANVCYSNESRNIVTAYNAYNGIIYTSMINSGKRESYSASLRGSLILLGNRLVFRPRISIKNDKQTGSLDYSFWNFNAELAAFYMLPCGFYAGLSYISPWGKGSIQDTSTIDESLAHLLQITASYSFRNLIVQIRCNPLYNYHHNKRYVELPGVNIHQDFYVKDSTSRLIMLSAKYTFDFGRKYQHEEMRVDGRRITSM